MPSSTILIVEDEKIVAKDIQKTLEGLGYAVLGLASSGEEALSKSKELSPDLILMDVKLRGEIDGIEAAKKIREHLNIPVVFLTAHADTATLSRAKLTESFGYIIKPFQTNDLHMTLDIALHRHRIEKKLKESEERYRDLYENAPDGYFAIDAQGKITNANGTLLSLSGYSMAEMIGKEAKEFVAAQDSQRFEEGLLTLRQQGSLANLEVSFYRKEKGPLPTLINASSVKEDGLGTCKFIVRDISNLQKLREEKEILSNKLERAVEIIPLTENEKKVFYGIVKYPLLNDVELSKKLKIKRSTLTAIKAKLRKEDFYTSYRIPRFSLLGCELLTLLYVQLNPLANGDGHRNVAKIGDIPNQVFLLATGRELMGISISRNLADFKKQMDLLLGSHNGGGLMHNATFLHFPFEISTIEHFLDYSRFLGDLFSLDMPDDQKQPPKPIQKKLTDNEKVILYALVKFPYLNDSDLSQKTGLSRPSISQGRRKFIEEGFLTEIAIPNLPKLKCELFALNHILFTPKQQAMETKLAYLQNMPSSVFMVHGDIEACTINLYREYGDYEAENSRRLSFVTQHNTAVQTKDTHFLPLAQAKLQKLDFAPLLRKILGVDVKF